LASTWKTTQPRLDGKGHKKGLVVLRYLEGFPPKDEIPRKQKATDCYNPPSGKK
jgi:hypothetical protein